MTSVGVARFPNRHTVGSMRAAVHRAPRMTQASKRLSHRIVRPIVLGAGPGTRRAGPRVVAVVTAMLNDAATAALVERAGRRRGGWIGPGNRPAARAVTGRHPVVNERFSDLDERFRRRSRTVL